MAPVRHPAPPVPRTSIEETPNEQKILDALRGTLVHGNLSTTPRVAGGWVRDKLLGRPSLDIDIAIDDCSGEEFAAEVNAFLKSRGEPVKSIGVIKANPDQSKHLATATCNVYGTSLDFVNLRTETYAADSRIPVIEVGTPLSDSERRDFTINALYYNIKTRAVEDCTGRGLADLAAGLLRTPIDPLLTFRDDPLRMLRCIRFASRYAWMTMHGDVCRALSSEEHHRALKDKVSNERVGIELMGALAGPSPALALELILKHGLADAVYKVPPRDKCLLVSGKPPGFASSKPGADWVNWNAGLAVAKQLGRAQCSAETFLAAALLPLHGLSTLNLKKKPEPTLRLVVMESLKLSKGVADHVQLILDAGHELAQIVADNKEHQSRMAIGKLVLAHESWPEALRFAEAMLVASRRFSKVDGDGADVVARTRALHDCIAGAEWALDALRERLAHKPVLDGKDVMRVLGIKGADTKDALDVVKEFCIMHPTCADPAEAEAYLKANWPRKPVAV